MARLVSAVILIAIVVATIWWLPPWATTVVSGLAAALAARELALLATHAGAPVPAIVVAGSAVAVTVALAFGHAGGHVNNTLIVTVLAAIGFVSAGVALTGGPPSPATVTSAAVLFMAPLYLGLPLGVLAMIRGTRGPAALTWLLVVIAVSDSAQYYAGRTFGRRKLAPLVSPAKTVEGAIGGLIAAVAVGTALGWWGVAGEQPVVVAVLAFVLAAGGMVGDLFESLLKRSAGVKDSASLIPGHGGVLDRIDSYLVAAPLYYLYLVLRG
jgi:phosphatidate cytidylyltransferase